MVQDNDKSEVPSTPVLHKPNELGVKASFTKLQDLSDAQGETLLVQKSETN